jgi:hypothetical protein
MISYVDLAPMAHISIMLKVTMPLQAGGWTWGESDTLPSELAREYGYSDGEARSLVHTYGRTVATVMPRKELGDRFRIYAWGVTTEICVGIREWAWSADAREYRPVGEYLSAWKQAIRAYYVRTGQYYEDKKFSARSGLALAPDLSRLPTFLNGIPAPRAAA